MNIDIRIHNGTRSLHLDACNRKMFCYYCLLAHNKDLMTSSRHYETAVFCRGLPEQAVECFRTHFDKESVFKLHSWQSSTIIEKLSYLDSQPRTQWSPVIREQGEGPHNRCLPLKQTIAFDTSCTMQTLHNTINQLTHKLHVLVSSHNHLLHVHHLLQFMLQFVPVTIETEQRG